MRHRTVSEPCQRVLRSRVGDLLDAQARGSATVEAVSVAVGDQVGEGTIVVLFAAEKAA